MKSLYALQPYHVGSRDRKSLAVIIPAKVVKQCHVDPSTIFTLKVDDDKQLMILQIMSTKQSQSSSTMEVSK